MKNTIKKVITSALTLTLAGTMAISAMAGASAKTVKTNKAKNTFKLSTNSLKKRAKIFYTTRKGANATLTINAKSLNSQKAVIKIYKISNGKKILLDRYTVNKSNGIGKNQNGKKIDLGNYNPNALPSGTYIDTNGKHYGYLTIDNLRHKARFWASTMGTCTVAKFTFDKNNNYTFKFASDLIYTAKASNVGSGMGIIKFSDAKDSTTYTLVSKKTENFSFFNNAQLKKMALNCFKAKNDSSGKLTVGIANAKYGCVTIEIRRSVNGISSLCERYTINRIGGTGFNQAKCRVDLNKFA